MEIVFFESFTNIIGSKLFRGSQLTSIISPTSLHFTVIETLMVATSLACTIHIKFHHITTTTSVHRSIVQHLLSPHMSLYFHANSSRRARVGPNKSLSPHRVTTAVFLHNAAQRPPSSLTTQADTQLAMVST